MRSKECSSQPETNPPARSTGTRSPRAWGVFFFKQKTAYDLGLGIPAEPLFRSTLFPILASLLVRLVVLLPFQLLRLSLATPSRWTPLALSVFLHCVVRSEERRVGKECRSWWSPYP